MTVAICIKCGETKRGALTPCPGCGFMPEMNEDKARSMIVTDHFLSADDLSGIGERIRSGQPVHYPQDAVSQYIKLFEEGVGKAPKRLILGCIGVLFIVVCVAVYLWVWGI